MPGLVLHLPVQQSLRIRLIACPPFRAPHVVESCAFHAVESDLVIDCPPRLGGLDG